MSETYTTIIPNVKDEEEDDVSLKIVFKKTKNPKITRAEAFDSKGRYFCESTLSKELFASIFRFLKISRDSAN